MPHVLSVPHARSTPMVGRDVLGAPRPRDAHGTPTGRHMYAGRRGRRPLPCLTHVHTPRPIHTHGRARRPRRAAPTGRTRDAHGNATCTRAAGDVGPYHASPMFTPPRPVRTPRPIHTHGRARRPRRAAPTGRPWDAHGNATCTRAAEDVGPYHASPMSTPYALSTPMVGRDVLGAPRPRDAHGTHTGTPRVRGPPRTSAPTMPHPCPHPTPYPHPW